MGMKSPIPFKARHRPEHGTDLECTVSDLMRKTKTQIQVLFSDSSADTLSFTHTTLPGTHLSEQFLYIVKERLAELPQTYAKGPLRTVYLSYRS
jgi:hypothetical protein